MLAGFAESNIISQLRQHLFDRLLSDLQTKPILCSLADYPGISLELLNRYLQEHGPLYNIQFGLLTRFYIDEEKLIPHPMFTYGKEKVVFKIGGLLEDWIKWNPQYGGRGTSSQGAFIIGHSRDVRMPDVAYTPRDTDRNLSHAQQWTYQGKPFCPSFVVEVDTLTGSGSQLRHLDYKMRNEYFTHGVELGWLIDPEHRIMIEYKKTNARTRRGGVYASDDHSWRNLSGQNVLPGFTVEAVQLDMVLNQASGSSSEDEFDEEIVCPLPNCLYTFTTLAEMASHAEWHRSENAKQKYLQRPQH